MTSLVREGAYPIYKSISVESPLKKESVHWFPVFETMKYQWMFVVYLALKGTHAEILSFGEYFERLVVKF